MHQSIGFGTGSHAVTLSVTDGRKAALRLEHDENSWEETAPIDASAMADGLRSMLKVLEPGEEAPLPKSVLRAVQAVALLWNTNACGTYRMADGGGQIDFKALNNALMELSGACVEAGLVADVEFEG
ncbi:MAG: hypothetical protein IPL32_19170 [Chloracidobacterium sp.]|nr:hypothetical protein [Chloracidobacterium sp.]